MGRREKPRAQLPPAPSASAAMDIFQAISNAVAERQMQEQRRAEAALPTGPAADAVTDALRELFAQQQASVHAASTGPRPSMDVEDARAEQFFCRAVKGCRNYMEDRFSCAQVDARTRLYGVYDGHGGSLAADLCRAQMLPLLQAQPDLHSHPARALRRAFESLDALFCAFSKSRHLQDGTTATVAILQTLDDGAQTLTVGNVGDSRCVLVRGARGDAQDLTRDHAAGLPDERARIEGQGGFLLRCGGVHRVQGCLAVSRALGDASLKPYVSSTPETTSVSLPAGAEPAVLCIATDGVWDELSSAEVAALLAAQGCQGGARAALHLASERGSEDNLTLMAIDLRSVAAETLDSLARDEQASSAGTSPAASDLALQEQQEAGAAAAVDEEVDALAHAKPHIEQPGKRARVA